MTAPEHAPRGADIAPLTPTRSASAAKPQLALGRTLSALAALCLSPRWTDVVRPAILALGGGFDEVVCYALGRVDEDNVPWQLAFLILLANTLEVPASRRLVYDPRHGPLDRAVLSVCGLTAMDVDERAERSVKERTLFFMPFAPYWLTDNVLRANWSQLHQIAVIGNPLRWVGDPDWDRDEKENSDENGAGRRRQDRRGRAPCADAVISSGEVESETVMWDGDMRTWLTEAAAGGGAEARASLDCEDGEDAERKGGISLHCLNATLATFRQRSGAPQEGPPRGKPLARSRL